MKIYFIVFLILAFILAAFAKGREDRSSKQNSPSFSLQLTKSGIKKYVEKSIEDLGKHYDIAIKEKAIEKIHDANLFAASRLAILKCLDMATDDPLVIRQGKYGFWKVIRKAKIYKLKKTFHAHHQKKSEAFSYVKGIADEKLRKDRFFSILSFNICFTPGDMPLVFGGMLPWEQRLERVVQIIEKADADVLCLQEVLDHRSHEILYERLKGQYAHFYTQIGPWNFKTSPLGFGSGLFVASKYPLKTPAFTLFQEDNPHINRGVFSFDVTTKKGDPLGTIFTTHLEPFKSGKKLREKELGQIISYMQSATHQDKPILLCGDLNLPIDEASAWIKNYFVDHIQIDQIELSLENCTSCDFTSKRWKQNSEDLQPEYLDYTLLWKGQEERRIETTMIKSFDQDNFTEAASDHHGLFTKVQI